ncbi:hypothetical protein C8N43_3787 [Litoreibacter ponti]|uniref:Uncharacterized protein n=1 Tax=Litoreibacter ponti TaxID=1510457 RepID=A0A2T6BFX4_9RHOB|nr:hypothetical protein C8N43_3787 [Litoreibacter ponti]
MGRTAFWHRAILLLRVLSKSDSKGKKGQTGIGDAQISACVRPVPPGLGAARERCDQLLGVSL